MNITRLSPGHRLLQRNIIYIVGIPISLVINNLNRLLILLSVPIMAIAIGAKVLAEGFFIKRG